MNELEKLTEAEAEAQRALRERNEAVDREARDAEFAARRAVEAKHADDVKALRDKYHEAQAARVAYLDSTVRHPLEGRRVIRQWESGYSWQRRKLTERGIIRVRRADTQLPYQLKSWARPAIGEAYIQHIKADGSEGAKVTKLFNKMQTEDEWNAAPPYDGIKGYWHLEPEGDA